MTKVFVKPASAELKVPLSAEMRVNGRKHLSPEGELCEDGVYWRRREREGDVVISDAPKAKSEAPRASKAGE